VIAVDSSALSKYILREEGWEGVRRRLEEGGISLEMALKEACNALWKRVMRGEVDGEMASRVVEELMRWEILRLADQRELIEEAFKISIRRGITLYDSLFIALAKAMDIPLLTSDERQSKAASEEGVEVIRV